MNLVETESDTLDVLLHGGKGGMNYSLMQKIFDASVKQGHSVVNFNFPFFERGEEQSSGPDLVEEVETLKNILNSVKFDKYKQIRLIGKSLGGAIGAKFLSTLDVEEQSKFSIIIFGYITGDIKLNTFPGKIVIIQGEKDKYGGINVIEKDLENAVSKDITYFEVPNADHSFRNEQKEPVYEDGAIEIFNKLK
ncbi:MAG TPA: alpha/beta family hydrolase [Patescibacteria group bacterium]|nr:alpha/beta family hydrolase [Patescibacteria group bacterium]